ncbi:MAG: PAS domain S-box protein [Spirochaetes bacterium]|nr:PAS domain S-box protein [Spirochaetota bacterium]
MQRRILALSAVFAIALCPIPGQVLSTQSNVLRVAAGNNYPPHEFTENGKPAGFDIDIIRAAAAEMGYTIQVTNGPYGEMVKGVIDGTYDVLAGSSIVPHMTNIAVFSIPTCEVSFALFVRKNASVRSHADLSNRSIVIQHGSAMGELFRQSMPGSRFVSVPDDLDSLLLVNDGQYDGAFLPKLQGLYYINRYSLRDVRPLFTAVYVRPYGFLAAKSNAAAVQLLNNGLSIIKGNGKYREIVKRWFTAYERPVSRELVTAVIAGIVVLVMLLLFAALFIIVLRRQVTRAVRDLAEREQNLATTLHSIGDAVIVADAGGSVTRMNPVAEHLTGWKVTEARGRPLIEIFRIVNAHSRKPVADPVARVVATGNVVGLANHTVLIARDGVERQIADSGAPIRDAAGSIVGVVLVFRDVTDDYAMLERIAASEERMSSLFTNMSEGVALHDVILDDAGKPVEYRIVDINPRYEAILGVKRADIVGKLSREAYGTPAPPYLEEFTGVGITGIPYRFETYFPPMDKHFSISVAPWGKNGFATIFSDISERKKQETLLREKAEELDRFFTTNLDLLCIADTDGNFHRINPEWEKALGYTIEELMGKKFLELVHPDDMEATLAAVANLAEQKTVTDFVNRYRRKDGSYRYIEWRSYPSGKFIHAAARDITERLAAEDALRVSEERNRSFLKAIPDLIFVIDRDGVFLDYNAERQDDLYTRPEYFLGKRVQDILPPDVSSGLMTTAAQVGRTGIMGVYEYELAMPTGSVRSFEARLTPYGPGRIAALVRDITVQKNEEAERKRREERFMQTEKLLSLGELTAGLAHEINQPLTAISLGLANTMLLASSECMDSVKIREKLSRLTDHVKRITTLMDHIRTFSRDQKSDDADVFDVAAAVVGALGLVRVQYENDLITFSVSHEQSGLFVRGNRYRLEQVILNLLTNARDSLTEKKQRGVQFRKTIDIRVFSDRPAAASIAVRDNGVGIAPAVLHRIFEPFFTTKPVGKGTGLGLSVSFGIMRDMNGTIEAESTEGEYAEFILRLPTVKGT